MPKYTTTIRCHDCGVGLLRDGVDVEDGAVVVADFEALEAENKRLREEIESAIGVFEFVNKYKHPCAAEIRRLRTALAESKS